MATPYYTSDDLINSIKRKIAFPINQNTFTTNDVLAFCNEEMAVSQVPSVLSFHEEYFVYSQTVPLITNISRYAIPSRAIGMRLRSIFWQDSQGNLSEMTRVSSDDKAYFQATNGINNNQAYKFYLENNDVVLVPGVGVSPAGSLVFYYFMRPNQLVSTDRVATILNINQSFTVVNSSLNAGDSVTLGGTVYTATAGTPGTNQFQIAGTSTLTASNLVTAITVNLLTNAFTANNSGTDTPVLSLQSPDVTLRNLFSTSNATAFVLSTNVSFSCTQLVNSVASPAIASNIAASTKIDFMQTLPGHKIRSFSINVPLGSISGNVITFPLTSVPLDIQVNDYIASENECIIPMIPDDLHSGLAERSAARILAAMGDQAGLQISGAKIQEINTAQGMLLDNRTEGNPKKILARHSLLRYGKRRPGVM